MLFEILRQWPRPLLRPLPDGSWVHDAIRHGVAAHVADALAAGGHQVPPALTDAAKAQFVQARRHRTFTLDVVRALNARGLQPTLLKGYGLAARVYPSALNRPATDVDLYVRPDEVATVEGVLDSMGLRFQPDVALADPLEDHHHRSWAGRQGLVEVHHRLSSGFGGTGFTADSIIPTVRATLDGLSVRYLTPEEELLYLAVHAANHAFLRVSWLVDLKVFVTAYRSLDWGALFELAEHRRLLRPVRAAFSLAERLVDFSVPSSARRRSWRARLDPLVFSEARVASAEWASRQVPAFLLHLYLTQSATDIARHASAGAKRALRRAMSRT